MTGAWNDGLPAGFVGCEVYQGFTIAISLGRYSIWNEAMNCVGGHASTRAEARRMVDTQLADRAA
jgi:hypothetical protein